MNLFRGSGHQPDIEALSAHVDGQLDAAHSRELDAHVAGCAACTEALAELRLLRTTLASMPDVEAPRSFRLRLADVEPARKAAAGSGWSLNRLAPYAGGLAAVLFVVVFGVDRVTQQSDSGGDSAAIRSAPETTGMIAEDDVSSPDVNEGFAVQPDAPGAITPPDTGTATPGAGLAEDGDSADGLTAVATGSAAGEGAARSVPGPPTDTAAPTGAPPSGDSAVPGADEPLPTTLAATEAEPGTFSGESPVAADDSAATPPAGMVPAPDAQMPATVPAQARENQFTVATATPELEALSADDDEDGNPNWLLVVEIAAAMVAVAAGAFILARRFMGRGEA